MKGGTEVMQSDRAKQPHFSHCEMTIRWKLCQSFFFCFVFFVN